MTNALVPINYDSTGKPTVNARDLHEFLEVGRDFSNWIKDRIFQYGFIEETDYVTTVAKIGERQNVKIIEYHLSIDMAKELSMVERNEKGQQARRYFIECEKALVLSPEQILLRQSQLLVEHAERQKRLEAEQKLIKERQVELTTAVVETTARLDIVEAKLKDSPGYYSITGYANIIGIKVTDSMAKTYGKAATKLSKELEIPIQKTSHVRWGAINAYHESVLARIMTPTKVSLRTITGAA